MIFQVCHDFQSLWEPWLFITPDTNLIETLYDMGHVYPGSAILVNLMEHIISEQFDHVAITRLGPLRIKIKPAIKNMKD